MLVHEKKQILSKDTINFINKYVAEIKGSETRPFTCETTMVRWESPSPSIIKINFDGAFDNQGFKAVLGIIARDERGSVLLEQSNFQENVTSAFTAEALACQLEVKTNLEKGWMRLIVEGDSFTIVRKCKLNLMDRSQIGPLIANIKQMGKCFQELQFSFVPRSRNEHAHNLAKGKMKYWQ